MRDIETEAKLIDDLQLLVEAVWGEEAALNELATRMANLYGYMEASKVLIADKKKELIELFSKVKDEAHWVEIQRKIGV